MAARCERLHVNEGESVIPTANLLRLQDLAINASAQADRARTEERAQQLQLRADLITGLNETHSNNVVGLTAQLDDCRTELRSRGEEIRKLIEERHADVDKRGAAVERAMTAENRDAKIVSDKEVAIHKITVDGQIAEVNAQLIVLGIGTFAKTAGSAIPMLMGGRANGSGIGVVDTTNALASDPPPLCIALAKLLWAIRNPPTIAALASTIRTLAAAPALGPLGEALKMEAPDQFAEVVAAIMSAPQAQPQQHSATNGHAQAAPPVVVVTQP